MQPVDESGYVMSRPELTESLSSQEFRQWYYLKTELVVFARCLRISPVGSKDELTERIARSLAGAPPPSPTRVRTVDPAAQLRRPVTTTTVIPPGQRCSQVLREFFARELGPSFRFDAAMREFIGSGEGRTLGEAADHWRETRGAPAPPIGRQFELNRFTRQWHQDHPGGHRDDLRAAWQAYKSQPEGRRGRA